MRSVVDHDWGAVVREAVHPLRVPVRDPDTAVAGRVRGYLGPAVEGPISIEVTGVVEMVRAEARGLRPHAERTVAGQAARSGRDVEHGRDVAILHRVQHLLGLVDLE